MRAEEQQSPSSVWHSATLVNRLTHEETHAVLPAAEAIESFPGRHLGDEDDLAVPIILHHRLRG